VRYWALATVATLTAFAVFTFVGSLAARLGATLLTSWNERRPPAARARLLFQLRTLPGLCAAIAAFGIALPTFLWFEAADTTERVNWTLGLAAAVGASFIGRGLWRAAAAWRATARVLEDWQRRGRPVEGAGLPLPAAAIEDPFPIVTTIGIWRPRLFIAERVLRECSPAEVAAMVAHETAHVSARDNLKRLLARMCPDPLGVGRRLDRAWSAAAEEAADARAAGGNAGARLDLAGALIHVARLAIPAAPPLASAFYLGGSIDSRVRRLVDPDSRHRDAAAFRSSRVILAGAAALFVTGAVLAAPAVHELMEKAVRFLP
jgi:hypothetical protein